MNTAGLQFEGLEPWEAAVPTIEWQVAGRLIDLHNCGRFLGYTFASDGSLTLTWHHDEPWDPSHEAELAILRFTDVRHFVATQEDDWDARAATDTEEWYYEPLQSGGALRFEVADSVLEFHARSVAFELRPV